MNKSKNHKASQNKYLTTDAMGVKKMDICYKQQTKSMREKADA